MSLDLVRRPRATASLIGETSDRIRGLPKRKGAAAPTSAAPAAPVSAIRYAWRARADSSPRHRSLPRLVERSRPLRTRSPLSRPLLLRRVLPRHPQRTPSQRLVQLRLRRRNRRRRNRMALPHSRSALRPFPRLDRARLRLSLPSRLRLSRSVLQNLPRRPPLQPPTLNLREISNTTLRFEGSTSRSPIL